MHTLTHYWRALLPQWVHSQVGQGVIITDAALRVQFWNSWMEQKQGTQAALAVGQMLEELFPHISLDSQRIYQQALQGETQIISQRLHRYLLPLPSPPGFPQFAQMQQSARVAPLFDGGNLVGTVTLIQDVSEQAAQEQTIEAALDQEHHVRLEIARSEDRYRALIEASSQVVWSTSDLLHSPTPSAWWYKLTGQQPEDAAYDGWLAFVHPEDRLPARRAMRRAIVQGDVFQTVYRVWTVEQLYRYYAVRGVPMRSAEGDIREWVGTFSDISERKYAEEMTALLADANALLTSVQDVDEQLQALASLAISRLADGCVIVLNHPGFKRTQILAHTVSFKHALLHQWLQTLLILDTHERRATFSALDQGQAMLFSEGASSKLRELGIAPPPELTLNSLIIAPMQIKNAALGVIAFGVTESRRRYNEFDLGMAQELARRTALMLESARAYNSEQQARQAAEHTTLRIERLLRITENLSKMLTPLQIAETVIEQGAAALNARAGVLALLAADGSALEVIHTYNYDKLMSEEWRRISLDTPVPLAQAVRQNTMITLNNLQPNSFPENDPLKQYSKPYTLIAFPLRVDERVIGAFGLSYSSLVVIDDNDREFLLALGQQCAVALERARLYEAERKARAIAESAVQVRDHFLSIASHELKTPLTSLLGNIELLYRRFNQREDLNERDNRSFQVVLSQIHRLNQLINTMLDVSRIELGQLQLSKHPMSFNSLVMRVIDEVQPILANHVINCHGGELPLLVDGDELRLEQVLQNLVRNAVKYSPDSPQIELFLDTHGPYARLRIADHGIGIPAESMAKLAQRFYRAPNTNERNISGTGVGLYVVKEIVELHGGQLLIQSTEGQGSTFTVLLPLATKNAVAGLR